MCIFTKRNTRDKRYNVISKKGWSNMIKTKFAEKYQELFENQIIYRGKEYFKNNKVQKVFKFDKGYVSKVSGSYNNEYTVHIEVEKDEIIMHCDCPYHNECKHEYATLLAIDDGKFKEIPLKPMIEKTEYSFAEFVSSIPEGELKKYIIKKAEKEECFDEFEEDLKEEFVIYLPKESREFFYTEVYNLCLLEEDLPFFILDEYVETIKKYIDKKDYEYAFVIYSSLIDAICDSGVEMSTTSLLELYTRIGIFARITYRKGNKKLKTSINNWIKKYESSDYNDDVYLEDFMLNIK